MKAKVDSRITYANVVATLALFVALGGSSYAALSITGKDVKNNSLTTKDVKNNSLTTKDVRNSSLLGKDFRPGQLPRGPQGTTGPQGARGAQGAGGATNVVVRSQFANPVANTTATCEAGERATGGGVGTDQASKVSQSEPTIDVPPTGWKGSAQTMAGGATAGTVYVICASP